LQRGRLREDAAAEQGTVEAGEVVHGGDEAAAAAVEVEAVPGEALEHLAEEDVAGVGVVELGPWRSERLAVRDGEANLLRTCPAVVRVADDEALVGGVPPSRGLFTSALRAFEPLFFNSMTLVLEVGRVSSAFSQSSSGVPRSTRAARG
jgi:hypothetical protein